MEPNRLTDPVLAGVLEELICREPIFHRPEFGTARTDFEAMTALDFWEVGASGRRYSREFILDELEKRHMTLVVEDLQASDFHCRALSDEIFLLTYTLRQGERTTRRASIWQRSPSGWQIVYHQGTVVQDA